MRIVKITDRLHCFSPGCLEEPTITVWTKAPGPRRRLCDAHAYAWNAPPNDWVQRAIRFAWGKAAVTW